MNKQLSDEQVDKLMSSLISSSTINDREIDEIASSPTLWWSVQRETASQKAAAVSPWPPSFNWLRVIGFAVPLLLLIAVVAGVFSFRSADQSTETAGLQQNEGSTVSSIATVPPSEPAAPSLDIIAIEDNSPEIVSNAKRSPISIQRATKRYNVRPAISKKVQAPATVEIEEVKSDFIALSYAQHPSSGQIVRVKVPSSMKVTLGMVDRVDRPTELVDAEVVVGDDGMTHAIRFIRQ